MTLETQVTTKEMSERLKEAGFEMEMCFHWVCDSPIEGHFGCNGKYIYDPNYRVVTTEGAKHEYYSNPVYSYIAPAYTFQQLRSILPEYINDFELYLNPFMFAYRAQSTWRDGSYEVFHSIYTEEMSLSNAAAEAVLWCIENDYLNVKDVK